MVPSSSLLMFLGLFRLANPPPSPLSSSLIILHRRVCRCTPLFFFRGEILLKSKKNHYPKSNKFPTNFNLVLINGKNKIEKIVKFQNFQYPTLARSIFDFFSIYLFKNFDFQFIFKKQNHFFIIKIIIRKRKHTCIWFQYRQFLENIYTYIMCQYLTSFFVC